MEYGITEYGMTEYGMTEYRIKINTLFNALNKITLFNAHNKSYSI